jgi:hypothetical protein
MKMYDKKGGMDHNPKAANERYMPKGMGGKMMGHEKKPMGLKVPCGDGMKGQMKRMSKKGYPDKAFDYKY